jgi:quercetin dioxygenase-like cupin family protein
MTRDNGYGKCIEKETIMRGRIMRAGARQTKQAPAANFTGLVLHEEVFAPEAPSRLRASRVTFGPGGRTNWHTHAVGQVLYVLSGVGRYQTLGEEVQVLRPGDTVVIEPGVKHWHGAAPDHMMAHLALSEANEKGEATTWLEPVSDADYGKAPMKA